MNTTVFSDEQFINASAPTIEELIVTFVSELQPVNAYAAIFVSLPRVTSARFSHLANAYLSACTTVERSRDVREFAPINVYAPIKCVPVYVFPGFASAEASPVRSSSESIGSL